MMNVGVGALGGTGGAVGWMVGDLMDAVERGRAAVGRIGVSGDYLE